MSIIRPSIDDSDVAEDPIIVFPLVPESAEFFRIRLPVGIGLEHVVGAVFKSIFVSVEQRRTMTGVLFCQRRKPWHGFCHILENAVRTVAASVIDNDKT